MNYVAENFKILSNFVEILSKFCKKRFGARISVYAKKAQMQKKTINAKKADFKL